MASESWFARRGEGDTNSAAPPSGSALGQNAGSGAPHSGGPPRPIYFHQSAGAVVMIVGRCLALAERQA